MGLMSALNTAVSSLTANSAKAQVVSRNVANASTPFASRKTAYTVSMEGGGVTLSQVSRVTNDALMDRVLTSTSSSAAQKAIVDGLDSLNATIGDPKDEQSPAALAGKLADALQTYSTSPTDTGAGMAVSSAAGSLASALNSATDAVTKVRTDAEEAMQASVSQVNSLLSQFDTVNREIVSGSIAGTDITDSLDQRDQILASLSEEMGVKTMPQARNGLSLYTDSGVKLYDIQDNPPNHTVSFAPNRALGPSTAEGNPVLVDSVAITGGAASMPLASGKLAGLVQLRDKVSTTYQGQLDETARGLMTAFAETNPVGGGGDQLGLFTYTDPTTGADAVAMPTAGSLPNGFAGKIKVSSDVQADSTKIRNGISYAYSNGSGHLQDLVDQVQAQQTFVPPEQTGPAGYSGTPVTMGVLNYASTSASWLSQTRSTASSQYTFNDTVLQRATSALSQETGINIDTETTNMLELQRGYEASSKIISTIDAMFTSLLQAV
jgi:flagellar hook-associated protein 1